MEYVMKTIRTFFKERQMNRGEFFLVWTINVAMTMISIFTIECFDKITPGILITLSRGIVILSSIISLIHATNCRLRDAGRSKWWYLTNLIPLGNLVFIILLLCAKSSSGGTGGGIHKNHTALKDEGGGAGVIAGASKTINRSLSRGEGGKAGGISNTRKSSGVDGGGKNASLGSTPILNV